MRPLINLRSDLRRLTDTELADRLDEALKAFEEASATMRPWKLRSSWRGPIAHPLAYELVSFLEMSGPFFWDFNIALVPSLCSWVGLDGFRPAMRAHLAKCEAADLIDEAKRRVVR